MITRYMSVVYTLQIWCICKDLYKTKKQIPVCRTEYSVHSRLVFKRNQTAISILKEVFAMNETDYNARLL